MANNALSVKSKAAGPGSLRITPSSSPGLRAPMRSPNKTNLHQSTLSLQTIIGTTTTTPNGFSSHDQSKSFALCAGSAAVLAELDDENNITQRFFKARPSANSINPVTSFYNQSTPPTTPDTRTRSLSSIKSTPLGNAYNGSSSNEFAESNSPRRWSSRERIKAVTSVSISPNGRFLAVGETGYNPRVLIFSTAKDASPDIPVSILTEHTFGVRSVSFSSNSQYLATLGDVNDGFLFVWAVNLKSGLAKLHSTNKCTSFVRHMCWVGQSLITVGVRHVKVWRLPEVRSVSPTKSRLNIDSATSSPSPAPKALSGRNCLLGSLGNNTFTCVASISDHEAVIGTESGALCFLDDSEGSMKLSLVKYMEFGITSLAIDLDQACVWIGGRGRKLQRFPFEFFRSWVPPTPPSPGSSGQPSANKKCKGPAITCMGSLGSQLVSVDSAKTIYISPAGAISDNGEQSQEGVTLGAHRDAVLGISPLRTPNELKADFFTWSCDGSVNFWDIRGICQGSRTVVLDQLPGTDDDVSNELKILRTTDNLELFVSGDKLGVLRVFSKKPWRCLNEVRAHGGEITDIALHSTSDLCLVATSGRDRMVQLFQRSHEGLQLIQTMDDHVGAVGQLLFVNEGEKLLSCSSDRTILIRERVTQEVDGTTAIAYLITKVITLKASPVSMVLSPEDPDILVISTVDRCIQQYDMNAGKNINSFRPADSESSDTVVMGALAVAAEIPGESPKLLIGVSGTDKSIRVYDFEREVLLIGEFGHAEGVSDVRILERVPEYPAKPTTRILVSAGIDGIVMIWNLTVQPHQAQELTQTNAREEDDEPCLKELTVFKPPLRKILSRNELAGFYRQENIAGTPTPARETSPSLIRKLSKFSLTPSSLKNGHVAPATPSPPTSTRRSPTSSSRLRKLNRSPSPSPKLPPGRKLGNTSNHVRRSSLDLRSCGRHSAKSEFGSLNMSTEQVCRTLKAYRKKLHGSTEHLEAQKELERQLGLTLRALSSRTKTCEGVETETDSSGKENERIPVPPIPDQSIRRIPHRMPSAPNLGQKRAPTKVFRKLSLNDDVED